MRRGEVWWVDFDPSVGGEIRSQRPAVILSSDASNRRLNRMQVVPMTTNVSRLYAGEAYVTVNGVKHKCMADQIKTVSKLRVSNQFGRLSAADLRRVEQAVRVQLGME